MANLKDVRKQSVWSGMTKKKSDNLFIFFMLLFPVLHFLVFWVYLNFESIMLAFEHPVTGELGFSNFERFFRQFSCQKPQISRKRLSVKIDKEPFQIL